MLIISHQSKMSDPNVIDLTGDSPISGGIRQERRRNGNVHLQDRVSSRPRINRLRSHMQNQLDDSVTLVIPDDNADEHFERHKILKNTGEVATFDGIISDESDEVPCINDSITVSSYIYVWVCDDKILRFSSE
ncbi:hypothetical protein KM043_007543 [Ampulex compressa]|nr:hypothetical protein KM043_007543 [Ampulex compressa]